MNTTPTEAPSTAQLLRLIEGLSAGWDEHGSTGPREPYSWETVARMAMDYARAALSAPTVPAAEAPKPATYRLTIHTDRWDATRRTFASDLVKATEPSSDTPRPVQPAEGETPSGDKPIAWWSGGEYGGGDEHGRLSLGTFTEHEDTWHDIPVYAGWNNEGTPSRNAPADVPASAEISRETDVEALLPANIGWRVWAERRCMDGLVAHLKRVHERLASPPPEAQAPSEPLCMCKDRAESKCPGEWEPGCDLGANEKFAVVHIPTPAEQEALRKALRRSITFVDAATPPVSEQDKRDADSASPLLAWILDHPETCAEELEDCAKYGMRGSAVFDALQSRRAALKGEAP